MVGGGQRRWKPWRLGRAPEVPAVEGKRPLVASAGLGPLSLWNKFMLIDTIIRWVWDLIGVRVGRAEGLGPLKRWGVKSFDFQLSSDHPLLTTDLTWTRVGPRAVHEWLEPLTRLQRPLSQ